MTVIGTGYLGATHAACMAQLGHEVLGIDVDPEKIASLSTGEVPFYEPGLPEILSSNIAAGTLGFTTELAAAAQFATVHFIGVGTPQKKGEYAADISYVTAVISQLVPLLTRDSIIVGKSTVPVGTAQDMQSLADELSQPGVRVDIVWNPEFLREGFAVKDTLEPDRIVIGIDDFRQARKGHFADGSATPLQLMEEVYEPITRYSEHNPSSTGYAGCPVIVTDFATAELVKVSANAFLATKISFINAVAEVCEASGADVTVLADAIGMDPRIGRRFLGAGLGFGGGCLPKDIRSFMARAGELGVDQAVTFLREIDAINMRRRDKMVSMAIEAAGGNLMGSRVAVLGVAFKPNSDDVRDSPALSVAGMLALRGAEVVVYDPKAIENSQKVFPTLNYADSALDACTGADVIIVATEWDEFIDLDPVRVHEVARGYEVLDGRNCLHGHKWAQAGWTYRALGRSMTLTAASANPLSSV